jgi:hypothetical protein
MTRPGSSFVWPELALREEAAYAFGFLPTKAPALPRGVAALRDDTEDVGVPAGAVDFFDPVLAVDRGGTLHALWGEHEEGAERDAHSASGRHGSSEQFQLGRVLYATHRNGRWSRAQVVYRAPAVSWHRSLLSRLEEDGGGNLHVAFVARRASSSNVLVHLRRGRDGWRTTEWVGERGRSGVAGPVRDSLVPAIGGIYPSLAAGRGGRLWVRRSDNSGLTWSAPVLVHRSGRTGGYELQIVATGRDSVHLLWRKQMVQPRGTDEIPHAISTDGGVTWRSTVQVPLQEPRSVRHLRAVATSKAELYIAFAQQPATGASSGERPRFDNDQVFYSHWRGSGWSVPRPLRPEVGVFPFDLRVDRSDRLHLLWAYMAPADSGNGVPIRVLSYAVGAWCAPPAS